MSHPSAVFRITDRLGTDYTDLFADVDFDTPAYMSGGSTTHPASVPIVNTPHSPRANADGPLGALIVRWIQARIETPGDVFAWQYVDATDTHTIAFTQGREIRFINIHGRIDRGRRVYDLKEIGQALDLRFDFGRSGV